MVCASVCVLKWTLFGRWQRTITNIFDRKSNSISVCFTQQHFDTSSFSFGSITLSGGFFFWTFFLLIQFLLLLLISFLYFVRGQFDCFRIHVPHSYENTHTHLYSHNFEMRWYDDNKFWGAHIVQFRIILPNEKNQWKKIVINLWIFFSFFFLHPFLQFLSLNTHCLCTTRIGSFIDYTLFFRSLNCNVVGWNSYLSLSRL